MVSIRALRISDVIKLGKINLDLLTQNFPFDYYYYYIVNYPFVCKVAELDDGELVGSILCNE